MKNYNGHEDDGYYCLMNPNQCAEANLDVQYMMAAAPGVPQTVWYTPDSTLIFESWIEAVANDANPPLVHSISYAGIETMMSPSVTDSFNTEAMKLGVQGVTIFAASGDDGVSNFLSRQGYPCAYRPSFPATSPYVTAVGATQGGVTGGDEVACSSSTGAQITTGGGFSTLFAAPAWQQKAISNYFSTAQSPEPGYNEKGRGYPDVAMVGTDYQVVIGGSLYKVSGTSASTPVVAAMASLVNARRLSKGLPALGFINPQLYAAASNFTDITSGENNCDASGSCCSVGFYAAAGWDPLTVLGSVEFTKFASIFVDMPSSSSNIVWYVLIGVACALVVAIVAFCVVKKLRQPSGAREPLVMA